MSGDESSWLYSHPPLMTDYLQRWFDDGAVSRVCRWRVRGWDIYLQVNTGPPTWWKPQGVWRRPAESPRRGKGLEVMIGWLRLCVGLTFISAGAKHPPD